MFPFSVVDIERWSQDANLSYSDIEWCSLNISLSSFIYCSFGFVFPSPLSFVCHFVRSLSVLIMSTRLLFNLYSHIISRIEHHITILEKLPYCKVLSRYSSDLIDVFSPSSTPWQSLLISNFDSSSSSRMLPGYFKVLIFCLPWSLQDSGLETTLQVLFIFLSHGGRLGN